MFSTRDPGTTGANPAAGSPHFLVSRAGFHFRIKEQNEVKVGGDYRTLVISSYIVLGVLLSD